MFLKTDGEYEKARPGGTLPYLVVVVDEYGDLLIVLHSNGSYLTM